MGLSNELIIDNFAGGGGASIGIEHALKRPISYAINHDPEAVALHTANHPLTKHFCEDVWEVNPRELVAGRPVGLVWLSPDCKHFSKAKGSKPVEKNIRGLAWVALRWASLPAPSKPRVMMLENVEEFLSWGRVIDGVPCPKHKGETFRSFVNALQHQGYKVEWKILRACDYGAPTIRKRLFMIARSDGQPIRWPAPTHGEGLKPYRTAAECIDFSIPCPSIFDRKRPLAENTMKRIARGLDRFVINSPEPFIIPVGYGERKGQSPRCQSINDPINTIVGTPKHAIVTPFLTEHANGSTQRNFNALEPLRTQCAQVKGGHFALVQAFLAKHFGGATGSELIDPMPTILSKGCQTQLVTSHIMKMYKSSPGSSCHEPLHTITSAGGKHAEIRAFLLKYYGNDKHGEGLRTPIGSLTSKDRFGLVTVHGEDYAIIDIGMRMLTPRELYNAQGFPEDYKINVKYNGKALSKTAQVRMCGNSVSPNMAKALVQENMGRSYMFEDQARKTA